MCLTSLADCLGPALFSFASLGDSFLLLAATAAEPTTLELFGARAWMVLSIAAGLGFVIFVHELGHFLVAKACGVKCDKFYIGFDVPMPKILGWQIPSKLVHFHWGETEYGIGILPLGGYVKMLGQDDDPRNADSESDRTKVTTETGEVKLDPRSYPAKSVPARMAIISAGVIMNLIFAVILAAIAYRIGVPEMPATIGGTVPGTPAWTAGIEPGSQILQFGKSGEPYPHLRWEDLMREVVLNGSDRDLPMYVRGPDGQETWHDIRPSDRLKTVTKRPSIGVAPQATAEVNVRSKETAFLDAQIEPPLEEKDKIVAVEGRRLEADHRLTEILANRPSGPLKVTVARIKKGADGKPIEPAQGEEAPTEEFEAVVAPRAMRDLGLGMKIGPIVAVRKGSPAAVAGFMEKDVIEQIDGQSVGDPLTLGQRLLPSGDAAQTFEFIVSRPDRSGKSTSKTLSVRPEIPKQFHTVYFTGGPAAIESIGIAFDVLPVVAVVEPGRPAEQAKLQPGDVITQYEMLPADEKAAEQEKKVLAGVKNPFEPVVLDETTKTWTSVISRLQVALPETKIKLTWDRNGKTMSGELTPTNSETWLDESRGLAFYGQRKIHRADNWSDAFGLGFRETGERLKEVLRVLTSLLTGNLSPTNLSGPAGIIYAAGSFASEGLPTLLIFLTLLSANLAVLNFLPIPALDGGHMLFLLAEWIRGKPVDERLQIRLTIAGVLCLLSLMVFATVMDIGRFLG